MLSAEGRGKFVKAYRNMNYCCVKNRLNFGVHPTQNCRTADKAHCRPCGGMGSTEFLCAIVENVTIILF